MSELLLSLKVNDALDGIPIEDLFAQIQHDVHDEAVAHYGTHEPIVFRGGCQTRVFSLETTGRDGWIAALGEIVADPFQRAAYLQEWDAAVRPVAVMHWWKR